MDALRRPVRRLFASRPARWAAAVAAALVLVLAVRAARGREVPVLLAARGALVQRVVASGRVMAPARIQLASLVAGRVVAVLADEGDRARAGDPLVRTDAAEAEAALAQARARVLEAAARLDQVRGATRTGSAESLRQAELQVTQAERDLARATELFRAGSASAAERDDAERALAVARSRAEAAAAQAVSAAAAGADGRLAAAALAAARAGEAAARARLAESVIAAPAAGIVIARDVEPGDVVQPGRTLLVLARDGETRLSVEPDERAVARVRTGQPAEVVADAFPDRPFRAEVTFVAPAVDAARGTIEVRLRVPEPPPFLLPDMTVSVNVEVARRDDAVTLPAVAVRELATSPWVLAVAGGRTERRPVRIGLRGDGTVEIAEGLAPGEAVVPPEAEGIGPGARVRPRPPAPAEPARAL